MQFLSSYAKSVRIKSCDSKNYNISFYTQANSGYIIIVLMVLIYTVYVHVLSYICDILFFTIQYISNIFNYMII